MSDVTVRGSYGQAVVAPSVKLVYEKDGLSEDELADAEAAATASTPGELKWGLERFASREGALAKMAETLAHAESLELHSVFRDDPDMSVFTAYTGNGPTSAANARFYAGARSCVLSLVAEVRRQRTLVEWGRDHTEHARDARDEARDLLRRLAAGEAIGDEVRAYFSRTGGGS